jgi:cell division protein FtsL
VNGTHFCITRLTFQRNLPKNKQRPEEQVTFPQNSKFDLWEEPMCIELIVALLTLSASIINLVAAVLSFKKKQRE